MVDELREQVAKEISKIARPREIHVVPELPKTRSGKIMRKANAVLEHVGSSENQVFFISELCRVASRVFISVPNRLFPIEHHTALPLVHYSNALFKMACAVANRSEWSRKENLILMTRRKIYHLYKPTEQKTTVGYTGILLGPFSSNLYVTYK